MNPQQWREEFLKRFYIYNLETKTPAGADKEAIAFIERVRAEAVKEEHQKLLATINKEIAIHEKIIAIHDILPKQWHEGNIAALSTLRRLLTKEEV